MSLKRWGLVSLALTGTLWALLATPYDGPWTGTNSAGRAVSFTVSGTGTAWTAFSYGISFSCPQVGTVTTAITQSGPGAITDGEFSYSSSTLAFTGSFDSPTTASGTFALTAYPVIHGLPFPPYVHTDYITLSGTWTAAFSGTLNSLELTAPNGGETWAAGSTHDITWTSLGEIANVALEYSANGGTDWTTIAAPTPNSGNYQWTLPGSPSVTGLVRVSDAAAPTIFDASDAVFSIVQAIPTSERQALIAFYNATTGDSWSDNHGWKTPPLAPDGFAMPGTEGTWFGVGLDEGLQVIQLSYQGNNTTGSLPSALVNLPALQVLSIMDSPLSGPIPAELGSLASLNTLRLANNQLTGAIPPELGGLANLQYLDLYLNQLTGSIPAELGGLTNLVQIRLHNNQLNGAIPSELGSLSNLVYLGLFSNSLTGAIPPELADMSNLQILALSHNQLSGTIPSALGGLTHLMNLDLDHNQIGGAIPAELGNLTDLMILWLGANQLTGPIPPELGNLVHLQWFHLNGNKLTGAIPASLANLTALISTPSITDIGYNALYTTDEALITFLNSKDPDWASTQTIAPADVTATSLDNAVIMVSWLPVTYTADAGHYQILMSDTLGGPYTLVGQSADKATSSLNVTSLTPGQRYYFVVRTVTNAHANNTNIVESGDSAEASAVAWTQINVQITGTILAGGLPLANVLMAGLPGAIVTNASGVYDASIAAGSSPTVTPTLEGYSFVPVSRAYTTVTEDQIAQDYSAFTIDTFTLTYTAGAGGTISGTTPQEVAYGGSGTEVTAVPNAGYHFVSWSDGVLTAWRTDINVIGDISATATFAIDAIPVTERAALIALYDATDGDNWANNSGWKTPPLHTDGFAMPGTEGSWFGISMDAGTLHVMYIHLEHNNLSGTIPAGLSQLTDLIYLNLEANPLSGTIPDELGSLPQLQQLWLRSDHLTGSIPASLGNLTHLYALALSSNQLSGSIPPELGNLTTNLAFLYLDNNQLSGSIPAELGLITILFTLDLQSNHLSGPIPPELGSFLYLRGLFLNSNQLSGTIPAELGNLASLEYLVINSNQLSGAIPTSLVNLTNLKNGFSKLGYNALLASDADLITFLNVKDPSWASTQTIAPTGITATSLDNAVIMVSWLPVTYTTDAGHYNVYISQTAGGPYTLAGETTDKATTAVNVTGLTPGQRYYFVVRTVTNVHANNASAVESENSTEASTVAWTQINVQITGTILAGGLPLANVLMAGLPGTVVTNASGVYDATVAAGWSGTIVPTLDGYTFDPVSTLYTSITEDQTAQDYTASQIVAPTITVVSPNGGVAWGIGSIHDVTWSSTGGITNVKLEYSVNSGADWTTIIETTSNSGSYPWTIPSPASGFCVIKVSDASDLGVTDLSDSVFSIIQPIPSSERQALIDLYNSTNGENWSSNSGWKTAPLYTDGFAMPGTEGTWFGVLVDSGRVIILDPSLNNLSGSLPASLGALTSLRTLNVSHNQLTGPIPASLGNLSSLQSLMMDFNSLSGAIPIEICNLENLQEIWLSRNDLNGTIPAGLGALVDLQDIRLDYNDLSGSIPAELGNLPELNTLFLMDNELTGSIPAELGGLASLVLLDLSLNQLSGEIPPELGNLANLQWLILHRNQLTGAIPEELGGLAQLQVLNLLSNQLSGPLPAALGDLSSLQNLRVNSNKLMGAIPSSLVNLVNLTMTDLAYNALYTADEALVTFLNSKDPDWASRQTVAPADVTATSLDNAVIMISWLPVTYTADAGYYQILMSDTLGGPYTLVGQTADKATSSLNVTNLTPGQRYYFVVRTVTNAHANNTNIVESGDSAEASAVAWTQINVQITGTVTSGGSPLQGVVMNGLPGSPATNASGAYNASVAAGSSPTVTPTLEGYSFVPVSRAYPTITEDQFEQDYSAFIIGTFTLTYTAGAGGTIGGTTPQEVGYGGNGTEVTAVPNAGYHFVSWSDGVTTASRTDINVIADITVTANFALGDSPYDGPWMGTNSEDRTVSLTVSGGGTAWSTFGYGIQFFCPSIGGTVTTTITQSGPGAITNGTFSYSSGTLSFAGTFGSPTTASGTYTLTNYPVIHGLPVPPFVHTDYITYSGTWTATFGGTIPTIGVTSPNGGESWALGTAHVVTWTQTDLTGTVTIDLYKGGVYQKTLGTPDATAGTFTWVIATNETVGADYRVLVWQGSVSDESDANFALVQKAKVDFNNDGQEDILWRYYGEGGYNRAWFLGDSAPAGMPLNIDDLILDAGGAKNRFPADGAINSFDGSQGAPAAAQEMGRKYMLRSPRNLMGDISGSSAGSVTVRDPRLAGGLNPNPPPAGISDPRQIGRVLDRKTRSDVPTELAALPVLLGGGDVLPVSDLSWQIVGMGDFNNDTHVDILWRNASSGINIVWFMNGTDWAGSTEIMPVGDLSWKVVGTGDFNNDTHVDILWRNTSSGENVVWYMNGTNWAGSAVLLGVSDQNWQIVGTGDFNGDGNVDLLWRYSGAAGFNVVWYLDNASWIGSAELIQVGDPTWQIVGTGDYNKDGSIDILWRYNGAGGYNIIWYMNGVAWSESAELLPVNDLTWRIVSR